MPVLLLLPGWATPGSQLLQAALKRLLRGCGLRCIEYRPGSRRGTSREGGAPGGGQLAKRKQI